MLHKVSISSIIYLLPGSSSNEVIPAGLYLCTTEDLITIFEITFVFTILLLQLYYLSIFSDVQLIETVNIDYLKFSYESLLININNGVICICITNFFYILPLC